MHAHECSNVYFRSEICYPYPSGIFLLMINVKPDDTHVNSDIQCSDW